jgi:(2R)-3-sulfolactate dehydrogenase (NADP+)
MTGQLSIAEARRLASDALVASGASPAMAASLAQATLSAACNGRPEMGFAHLADYLTSLREGRIDGQAEPTLAFPLPAFIHCDAQGGIAQLGFDLAFEALVERATTLGIAIFSQANSYTAGELGYYVRRLAERGLIALAAANSHAMMATAPGTGAVFGTNPLAFAAPRLPGRAALVIDQATSATAFVNLLRAAEAGEPIPADWAIDRTGAPTTDAAAARHGALLPFGGFKGANLALMVEVLAAGLAGAQWSSDAGHFQTGDRCPATGLTVIAIASQAGSADFAGRLDAKLEELAGQGLHIPGAEARGVPQDPSAPVAIEQSVLERIRSFLR